MSTDPKCTTPEGGSTIPKLPCDDLAWDGMMRRFENDVQSTTFGDWIQSDLDQMEVVLAAFVIPPAVNRRLGRS